MHEPTTKTYYLTDKCKDNKFPPGFVNSTNKRYIEVHPCYMTDKSVAADKFEKGAVMHADFVQREFYQDHALCFCNQWRTKYKKYEYRGNSDTFNLWFTDRFPETKIEYSVSRATGGNTDYINETDYDKAYNRLYELFPDQDDRWDIDLLWAKVASLNPPFSKAGQLLNRSRYINPNSATYSAFDFIDHFAATRDMQTENLTFSSRYDEETPTHTIDKTNYTYFDANTDHFVFKSVNIWHKKFDGPYKFIAEFLLMY